MNATDTHLMHDLRNMKAQAFAACLMEDLKFVIPGELHEYVYRCIFESLYRNGGSWTTDEERQKMGFEPRDKTGWTLSERAELERKRCDAMYHISTVMAPKLSSEEEEGK